MHPNQFIELVKKGYSTDHIYLLNLIKEEGDISELLKQSEKVNQIHKTMIRKGLLTDCGTKTTTIGEQLIEFCNVEVLTKLKVKVPSVDEFDNWWKSYPGTDTFTHKSRKFIGSRNLRAAKEDCRIKFNKILLEGEYTAFQLTEALKYDVHQKKEASVKEGRNKLTFMQNSLTYLNQRSYEPFIELINQGVELESTPQSGTDI